MPDMSWFQLCKSEDMRLLLLYIIEFDQKNSLKPSPQALENCRGILTIS